MKRGLVYHNLAVMLEAGLPLVRMLRTAADGAPQGSARALERVAQAVSDGETLAGAMAAQGAAFEPLDVAVVRAGEVTGHLGQAVRMLEHWYDFRDGIRRRLLSGLIMPAILLHAAAFIFPLPALFIGGLGIGGYFLQVAGTLSGFYIAAAIILAVTRLSPRGLFRRAMDEALLRTPLLGRALEPLALGRYCEVFRMGLASGLPLVASADLASDACGNAAIAARMQGARRSAADGEPMSAGFTSHLPPDFVEAWRVGEFTGSLDDVCERQANARAQLAEQRFADLATWIPRIIYFLVSAKMVYMIMTSGVSAIRH